MSVGPKQGSAGRGGAGRQPAWRHFTEDPRQVRLMQWLVTPPHYRNPPTRAELAAEIGVSLRTLQLWMSRADFRDDWREEAEEVIGDENRAKHVLDVLYQAAIDPNNRQQVQAAKLYLEATKAIQPTTKVEVVRPKDLTDEELDAMLAENAAIAKAEHQLDSSVADGD